MARKCPDCGRTNDDEMSFCTECGEPLDPQVRLVMELEGKKAPTSYTGVRKVANASGQDDSRARRYHTDDDDDDDYSVSYDDDDDEKKSPVGWIVALIAVVAVVAWLVFF